MVGIESALFVLTIRRDMLRVLGSEIESILSDSSSESKKCDQKNWSAIRRRWLGAKTR